MAQLVGVCWYQLLKFEPFSTIMEIKGKIWLLFEQSGTFKNEFKKLGYEAVDVDIQNNFGETDYVIDLFEEIEDAYRGGGKYL